MRAVLLAVPLVGCFYAPRSYAYFEKFPGKRVALSCLDLAVTLSDDDRAKGAPIVEYSFGNHCTHDAIVDLPSVRVIGRFPDGTGRALVAYDPRHELRALPIDGWWYGKELVQYNAPEGSPGVNVVCLEVGHVERSPDATDHWVCLGASDEGGAL